METIPWYQSAIVRQQIVQIVVAATALLGVNLGGFDVDATLTSIFAGIAGLVGVWTLITRIFKPAPNLSQTANKKEVQMVKDGDIPPSPTGPGSKQGGFFRTSLLLLVALASAGLAFGVLSGCAANPNKTAQTAEQHGDAVYGQLVILKEQGTKVLYDSTIADAVKRPIAEIIVEAKPVTDGIQDAVILYSEAKAELAAGTGSQERLAIVDRELAGWIAKAQPIIAKFTAALAGAKK